MQFSAFEEYRLRAGVASSEIIAEEQTSDYEAGQAKIGSGRWRIRTARVTPTKPGAFVAVWKRSPSGNTQPFESSDACDGLLVFVQDGSRFGVFTFTREHLVELGVVQSPLAPGKRGFRVYPSWSTNLNAQATRTQRAQAGAFADLSR
jgi:hypothetical protein